MEAALIQRITSLRAGIVALHEACNSKSSDTQRSSPRSPNVENCGNAPLSESLVESIRQCVRTELDAETQRTQHELQRQEGLVKQHLQALAEKTAVIETLTQRNASLVQRLDEAKRKLTEMNRAHLEDLAECTQTKELVARGAQGH